MGDTPSNPTTPLAWLVAGYADGSQRKFAVVPAAGQSPLTPGAAALLGPALAAVYVPLSDPTPVPVPTPTSTPARPTDGPVVAPGESWADALRAAKPGTTVYLVRGETYTGPLLDAGLRLAGVRLATWGEPARPAPIVQVQGGSVIECRGWENVTLTGIRFMAVQPTAAGLKFWSSTGVTLERCEVQGFTMGVTTEPAPGGPRPAAFRVLSCRIWGNYNPTGQDSSGLYAGGTDGLVLKGNAFDRNGWREGVHGGTARNHGAYLAGDCGPAEVTGNTFARSSSHGLQCRCGGTVASNYFIDNPIHLSFGLVNGAGPLVRGGATGEVRGNVFVGTRPLAGSPRGWAIELANVRDVRVVDNVVAYDGPAYDPRSGTFAAAVKVDGCRPDDNNPYKGSDRRAPVGLVIQGNKGAGPWGAVWANPEIGGWDAGKCETTWPAADVAGARAVADRLLAGLISVAG